MRRAVPAALVAIAVTTISSNASAIENRIFTHRGAAAIYADAARAFLGTGSTEGEIVAYSYREHRKNAPPGPEDLCPASGVAYSGDASADVIYVTSSLRFPADLSVYFGDVLAGSVTLPADQSRSGQQSTIQIGAQNVGAPHFVLSRGGSVIQEWQGRLEITSTPPIRTVSMYSDYETITGSTIPEAWFTAVSMDKTEGNTGAETAFTVRLSRNVSTDTLKATCRVEAGTASASDFVGGALPVVQMAAGPGSLSATGSVLVRGDTEQEGNETFTLVCGEFESATPYSALIETRLRGTILNDDAGTGAPRFSIRSVAPSALEGTGTGGGVLAFEITRLGDVSQLSQIDFCPGPDETAINSATASDFVGGWNSQVVDFDPSAVSKYVEMQVVPDAFHEPDESVAVRLENPSPGTIVDVGIATARVIDDDSAFGDELRVNAGSDESIADGAGDVWIADIGSGGAVATNEFQFSGTTDDFIFNSYRYGSSKFILNVEPGTYRVTGLFSEPDASNDNIDCGSAVGRRRIQAVVSASGGDNVTPAVIDPYCAAGFRTAYQLQLAEINAPQGEIEVNFLSAPGSQSVPLVNGLSAIRVDVVDAPRVSEWLNVGAAQDSLYSDASGNVWRGIPTSYVSGCTSVADASTPQIGGTEADSLYWTRCQGMDISFVIPLDTSGGDQRTLSLLFSEPTAGPSARVMDVYVNGTMQIQDLDVSAAAGGVHRALIRAVSPVTVGADDAVRIRLVAKTGNPAIISGISLTGAVVAGNFPVTYVGWKQSRRINKRSIINSVSPTGLSQAGRPLVVRNIDTTNSSVYACHGSCDGTATHGVQPDTDAANATFHIDVMAHVPGDQETSEFPALDPGERVEDSFTVSVGELLPDGNIGSAATVTVPIVVGRGK